MAHEYTTQAYKLAIPSLTKFVLIALADRANQDGECWPSIANIATMTTQTTRSVYRHIAILIELGYLQKWRRVRKDGYRAANGYKLTILPDTESGEIVSPKTPILDDRESPKTAILPDTGDNSYLTQSQGNRIEPSKEPSLVESGAANAATTKPASDFSEHGSHKPIRLEGWIKGHGEDDGWIQQWGEWAVAEYGMTAAAINAEFDKFRDHYRSKGGQGGISADWPATWRNWIRRSNDFNQQRRA